VRRHEAEADPEADPQAHAQADAERDAERDARAVGRGEPRGEPELTDATRPFTATDVAYAARMSAIPATFQAFVAERSEDGASVARGVRAFHAAELPGGEVEVRIAWSSVNYKDALATVADGKVARISPLIPGIDLGGTVVASGDPTFAVGDEIIAHGYDLGVARHGGYGEFTRLPADYLVPLPAGLSLRDAMAIGTAGFTAAMSVTALERNGVVPGIGPVVVTGASGGVGSVAVAILAARGHEVWAATGKADEEPRLRTLGAAGIVPRDECTAASPRPLESARWAGAVDTVGAATLPWVLRTLRPGGAVASSGNAGGAALSTTVLPFILRGVALLGMDSANMPIAERRALWSRIAADLRPAGLDDGRLGLTEVALDELEPALDAILAGGSRGRWLVRVGGGADRA
jgi:putative YhdH/YhfP family quinone oxidoreductase